MAGMYQDSKTKIYYVTWRDKDRKKRHKSTGSKIARVAEQIKKKMESQLDQQNYSIYDKIPIKDVFDKYIDYLDFGCTEKHVKTQKTRLSQFIGYEKIVYLSDITEEKIDHYLQQRKKYKLFESRKIKDTVSATTIKHDYTVIKAFLNWCVKRKYISVNPTIYIDPPKVSTKLPEFLEQSEIKKLLDYLSSEDFEKEVPHETVSIKYIIYIEMVTGLRFKNELFKIRKKDIIQDRCEIKIHKTKTNKFKVVPYPPFLNQKIQSLLDTLSDDELLFPIKDFPRKQWQKIKDKLNISISPYKLKHTFATHFYMQTKDIRTLQEILGHSSINTTNIYTHTANDHKRKMVEQFNYDFA